MFRGSSSNFETIAQLAETKNEPKRSIRLDDPANAAITREGEEKEKRKAKGSNNRRERKEENPVSRVLSSPTTFSFIHEFESTIMTGERVSIYRFAIFIFATDEKEKEKKEKELILCNCISHCSLSPEIADDYGFPF